MKRTTLGALLIISTVSLGSLARPRQTFEATMTQMPQHKQIGIVAHNIRHEGGVTYATGSVRVRITPIPQGEDRTVIRADEVIYHGDTGEIETRGDASITIEKAQ